MHAKQPRVHAAEGNSLFRLTLADHRRDDQQARGYRLRRAKLRPTIRSGIAWRVTRITVSARASIRFFMRLEVYNIIYSGFPSRFDISIALRQRSIPFPQGEIYYNGHYQPYRARNNC